MRAEAVEIPELGQLIALSGYLYSAIARNLGREVDAAMVGRWTRNGRVPVGYLPLLGEMLACNWDVLGSTAVARSLVVAAPVWDERPRIVVPPPPPPRPRAPLLHFGRDGTPMGPGRAVGCSCGRPVR